MAIVNDIKELVKFARGSRASFIILIEAAAGIFMAITSLILFADIADEVISNEILLLDNAISTLIYGAVREPFLTQIMFAITFLGSKEFLFLASLAVLAILFIKKKRRETFLFTVILLTSTGLNNLIKLIIHRDRPSISPLEDTSFYSFPSGHSMNSFVFYSLLAYLVFHFTRSKTLGSLVWVMALILIAAIGFSRVYLGAHYPSDVIAGFIAGFWVFVTALAIDKTLKLNRMFKESLDNQGPVSQYQ